MTCCLTLRCHDELQLLDVILGAVRRLAQQLKVTEQGPADLDADQHLQGGGVCVGGGAEVGFRAGLARVPTM